MTSHSSNESNGSQDSQGESSTDSKSSKQIKRKQHETYTRLLQEQCFGLMESESTPYSLSNLQWNQTESLNQAIMNQLKTHENKVPSILKYKKPKLSNASNLESLQENTVPHQLVNVQSDIVHYGEQNTKERRVSKLPFKVLDAPNLQDDFYLNLVDWSSTNLLAVGLKG